MESKLFRDSRSLEEAFFFQEDQRLVESLREMHILEQTTGLLSEVSGITDKGLLEHLARLKVTPSVAAGLAILPLVEVAWSDGRVDPDEKAAVLASLDQGLFFQTIDRDIVEAWLDRRPPQELFAVWERYVGALTAELSEAEKHTLGQSIVTHARQVALAAGGLMGLGGVSKNEQLVLDRVAQAFQ